jgi:hypothetical protein
MHACPPRWSIRGRESPHRAGRDGIPLTQSERQRITWCNWTHPQAPHVRPGQRFKHYRGPHAFNRRRSGRVRIQLDKINCRIPVDHDGKRDPLFSRCQYNRTGHACGSGVLVTGSGSVPSIATDIPTAVTIGGAYVYRAGGTDIPVADGGTGKSSWTQYGLVYADAATSLNQIAIGTAGQVLTVNAGANGYTYTTPSPMVYPVAGVPRSIGTAWGASYTVGTAVNNLVQLDGSGALPAVSGANLTSLPSSMVYPGAGVPNSSGAAWGTSYTVGTAANNLVQLDASAKLPDLGPLHDRRSDAILWRCFDRFRINLGEVDGNLSFDSHGESAAICLGSQYGFGAHIGK